MGTSASNGGPKGAPPLLPDWYPDAPQPPEPEPPQPPEPGQNPEQAPQPQESPLPGNTPTKDWGAAKGALTRVSNGTGGSSGRKAAGRYLNTLGGSKAATRAAARGVSVGSRFAGFLGSVAAGGMTGTLQSLGLQDFVGRTPDEICAAIANALAPIGSTNDEAIARDALIATLDTLYAQILEGGGSLDDLNALSPELLKGTLIEYVSNFIFTKWMYELGIAIEKGNVTEQEAISLESEVKDLILTQTTEQYRDMDVTQLDLNDTNTIALVSEIFETAYSTLEL
jgi:hypothetical protein